MNCSHNHNLKPICTAQMLIGRYLAARPYGLANERVFAGNDQFILNFRWNVKTPRIGYRKKIRLDI